MDQVMLNAAMILFGIMCFILGLRCGYRRHRSEIIPKKEIENPHFQVIYIDPKLVREMYGIPEPKSGC